ncbi:MAG: hypothetical protein HN736_16965 [Anaerolineae bacterium]|jgi:hypothetical protein|nr:hypothetical protein [Anaerolineae bacterium]MBT4310622.1 hypothetical protein [Anaerolineae bacterium]MBT4458363.1 hypothetical protein [Anaerolineae bacterium]MBT6322992.1 hypothetical protein [Anaerolineae bacterium]MBT6813224.1 hypothetical protein [Anaerolineae bacterium]
MPDNLHQYLEEMIENGQVRLGARAIIVNLERDFLLYNDSIISQSPPPLQV